MLSMLLIYWLTTFIYAGILLAVLWLVVEA